MRVHACLTTHTRRFLALILLPLAALATGCDAGLFTQPEEAVLQAPSKSPSLQPTASASAETTLRERIEELQTEGALNLGQARSLLAKLEQAAARDAAGQPEVGARIIEGLVAQVESLVAGGVLTAAQGETLTAPAEQLRSILAGEIVLQTRAYVAGADAISVVDEATRTVVATIPDGGGSPALTPDGSAVYAPASGGVNVIDTGTNTVATTIPVDFPGNVAVAPDGDLVYVTSVLGNVTVIETATNTVSSTLSVGGPPGDLAVSPDGSRLYVSDPNAGVVYVFDTASTALLTAIPTSGRPGRVAISPDGTVVYVQARFPDAVELIDAALDQVVAQIPFSGVFGLRDIALSSDGSALYALGGQDLAVIETATNSVVRSVTVRFTAEQGPARVAASPGGSTAYVTRHDGNDPGDVLLVDAATGEIVATVEVGVTPTGVDVGMVPVSP